MKFDIDTLKVEENGHVSGQVFVGRVNTDHEEYDVVGSVTSYDYENSTGEKVLTNHVPYIVVSKINGSIIAEPEAHDSHNPERAIENTKSCAKYVAENIEEYI